MLGGFSHERQGHRNFSDFDDFYEQRIKPFFLGDLDTVFKGSKQYWKMKCQSLDLDVKPGRGDPYLAACLFSAFDHFGAFLASSTEDSCDNTANVMRTASYLPSTADIPHIIAALGRNPIIHYNWTQTAMPMDHYDWAFGLDICASLNDQLHNILTMQSHPLEPSRAKTAAIRDNRPVLKLILNVYVLHREFEEWVLHGRQLRDVKPAVFQKVQDRARREGWWREPSNRDWTSSYREDLHEEIENLQKEALDLGVWTPETPEESMAMYRRRSGGTPVPPHLFNERD